MPNELQTKRTSETIFPLDQLELLILIEEEFSGVDFSVAAVDRIEVVGDLIRYIEITCLLGDLYAQAFSSSAA